MLFVLDKLIILFIYVNILANRINIGILPIGKWIMGLSFFIYLIYLFKNNIGISKKTIVYIFICFLFIFILSGISIFLGNDLKDVMEFITMLLFLFTIPIFISLFKKYGVDRYLGHLLSAIIMLTIYFCLIYIVCELLGRREVSYEINENSYLMTLISYPKAGIRIYFIVQGFLPIGLLITYYIKKMKSNYSFTYWLFFAMITFALYLSQNLSIWFAGIFGMCLFKLIIDKFRAFRVVKYVLFLGLIFVLLLAIPRDIFIEKQISIYQKERQMAQALAIFSEKPLLGEGVGYVYTSSKVPDVSGLENKFLEVSYFMILSSTGLIGVLFFSYIYLYNLGRFIMIKDRNMAMKLFFVSHITVLIAGVGNPYIWSGGFGLLFSCLLAAAIESRSREVNILERNKVE